MPCRIYMPNRTHEAIFGDSIAKLVSVVRQINSCPEEEVFLDFTHSRILNPFFLSGLACLINQPGSSKFYTHNCEENPFIRSYLTTVNFPGCLSPNDDNIGAVYEGKTYLPIINFKTDLSGTVGAARDQILGAFFKLIRNRLGMSEQQFLPVHYFLSELTDNINEHSLAHDGYVFAQFYPNSGYLDMCICDGGQGIFQSYLNHPAYHPQNEVEAMQLAITGRSTKGTDRRGFGITTTRRMLTQGLDGKLFMWSGNTTFNQSVDKESIVDTAKNAYFKGMFIAIRLPVAIPGTFNFYDFVE